MNTSSLVKKVIVVTGATGYIGSSVAKSFSEAGATIVLMYNHAQPEKVSALVSSLHGDTHKAYKCDLTDERAVIETLTAVEQQLGAIYGCIHTAGEKPLRKKLLDTPEEDLDTQVEGTILTSFNILRHTAKKLQAHKEGVIVAITTAGVVIPQAAQSLGAYTLAKYAVQGMLVMLKEELKNSGVRVYSVAPGFMEGGMNSDIPKAFVEIIKSKSATKKITSGEEVATKVLELCIGHKENLTHSIAPEYE